MRLDLHLHSTASDGACSPGEVVARALEARLDVIALSDHDTTGGVPEAVEAARGMPIHVIPAVEVSSTWEGHDIHVLGYFVDPRGPALAAYAERARSRREERMREMLRRLEGLGISISLAEVRIAAEGDGGGSLARPHLARALADAGHVDSVPAAFDRLIGDDGPAFVPTRIQPPEEAVELVLAAGGVPVWAHPPAEELDRLLPRLVDAGLRGLEAYRPNHRPEDVERLLELASAHGLLVSGGSDWHGPDRGKELGRFWVDAAEVEELLEVGGL